MHIVRIERTQVKRGEGTACEHLRHIRHILRLEAAQVKRLAGTDVEHVTHIRHILRIERTEVQHIKIVTELEHVTHIRHIGRIERTRDGKGREPAAAAEHRTHIRHVVRNEILQIPDLSRFLQRIGLVTVSGIQAAIEHAPHGSQMHVLHRFVDYYLSDRLVIILKSQGIGIVHRIITLGHARTRCAQIIIIISERSIGVLGINLVLRPSGESKHRRCQYQIKSSHDIYYFVCYIIRFLRFLDSNCVLPLCFNLRDLIATSSRPPLTSLLAIAVF